MGSDQSKASAVPEYAQEFEAASYEQLTEQVSVIARLFAQFKQARTQTEGAPMVQLLKHAQQGVQVQE